MIKIMSLKRYKCLKEAADGNWSIWRDLFKDTDERLKAEQEANKRLECELENQHAMARSLGTIHQKVRNERDALATELEKYKVLFADELQKRLSLSEKVRALEKAAAGSECDSNGGDGDEEENRQGKS
jgi:hypothetical protein